MIFQVRFPSRYGFFFLYKTGIFLNYQLSWDDREIDKETIALHPVEKDQVETKLAIMAEPE